MGEKKTTKTRNEAKMDKFFKYEFSVFYCAYLEAIAFTDADEIGNADFSDELLSRAREDCRFFFESNTSSCTENPEQAGHDFWLTRNGHGAGFWSREEIWPDWADLTKNAKAMGECETYLGDDGLAYCL